MKQESATGLYLVMLDITYEGVEGDTVIIKSPNTDEYDCGICLENVHHLSFNATPCPS